MSLHRSGLALSSLDGPASNYAMIRFVQQISSADFQKEELDHACWGSSRIRVAGVVWEERGQEAADGRQGRRKDFPEATVLSTMHTFQRIGKCVASFLPPLLYCRYKCRYRGAFEDEVVLSRFLHKQAASLAS